MFGADKNSNFAPRYNELTNIKSKVIKKININKEMENEKTLMQRVRELIPGECTTAPLDKLTYVRASVSAYGKMAQKKFTCNQKNDERVVVITRIN